MSHPSDQIPDHARMLGMAPLCADGGYGDDPRLAAAFMRLPWPGHHLDPSMSQKRRDEITAALGLAPVVASCRGNARSRLQPLGQCGGAERGNAHWVWPVGLEHYVGDHGLALDPAFLASLGLDESEQT